MNFPILMYHKVADRPKKDVIVKDVYVTPRMFADHMRYLKKWGFTPIGVDDLLKFMNTKKGLPARPVMITFDDAYENVYLNAFPILKAMKFKAAVFVQTAYIGGTNEWDTKKGFVPHKIMTAEQLATMSQAGFDIGSHTHTHPDLRFLKAGEKGQEIAYSKTLVETIIGKDIISLAYPYGLHDEEDVRIAEKAGYKIAFTTGHRRFDPAQDVRFSIPRVTVQFRDYLPLFFLKVRPRP